MAPKAKREEIDALIRPLFIDPNNGAMVY